MIGQRIHPPVFGPRNSVVRHLLGETVSEEDSLLDHSEWVIASHTSDFPEVWSSMIHDYVYEGE